MEEIKKPHLICIEDFGSDDDDDDSGVSTTTFSTH
jgi:hypothetical protein